MKLRILISFVLIKCIASFSYAQKLHDIDSLKKELLLIKEDTTRIDLYLKLGWEYKNIGVYDSAMTFVQQALTLSKELDHQKGMGSAYNYIGVFYNEQGYYDKAFENLLQAIRIREAIDDTKGLGGSYINIGLVYFNQANFEKALEYFTNALHANEAVGNKNWMGHCHNAIGVVYEKLGRFDEALDHLIKSLKVKEEIGDKQGIAYAHSNIGNLHYARGDKAGAIRQFQHAYDILKDIGDKAGMANSYQNIGVVSREMGRYQDAVHHLEGALVLAKQATDKRKVTEIYEELPQSYAMLGDFKKAYDYQKIYTQAKDSLNTERSKTELLEMQTKYETEKKERDLEVRTQELAQQKEKNRLQLMFGSLVLAMVILVGVLIYNHNRVTHKAKLEQEVNRQRQLRFKEVLSALEQERVRIAKDLHDGVGQLLSGLKLRISKDATADKESLAVLNQAAEEVRSISHQMMPNSLVRFGLPEALNDLFKSLNTSESLKFDFEHFGLPESISQNVAINLYRMAQEISSNIIKHSGANHAYFNLYSADNNILLMAEDNGKGISENRKNGIGLSNIISRAESLGGKATFENKADGGAVVKIAIPISVLV